MLNLYKKGSIRNKDKKPCDNKLEMKQVLRELKKPEVKAVFKSIIVDTADVAAEYCQKYICNQLGIENIGDGGWSVNGWAKYKKEFEDTFRTLTQLGYAVVFISHDKEKTIAPKNGKEYQQIGSSMQSSALSIIEAMSDIIGYAHAVKTENETKRVLTLRSDDESIRCGCRFEHIAPEIEFSYEALTTALNDAIDKAAAVSGAHLVTTERMEAPSVKEYNYEELMSEFQTIAGELMREKSATNGPKITQIIEKYLGKGKKIVDTTRDQAEFIYLIVNEIKEELMK